MRDDEKTPVVPDRAALAAMSLGELNALRRDWWDWACRVRIGTMARRVLAELGDPYLDDRLLVQRASDGEAVEILAYGRKVYDGGRDLAIPGE